MIMTHKPKTAFLCHRKLDLHQTIPKYRKFQLDHIVSQIDNTKVTTRNHQCIEPWKTFLQCFRHATPNGYNKCNVEATHLYKCLNNNHLAMEASRVDHIDMLKYFNLWDLKTDRRRPTRTDILKSNGSSATLTWTTNLKWAGVLPKFPLQRNPYEGVQTLRHNTF